MRIVVVCALLASAGLAEAGGRFQVAQTRIDLSEQAPASVLQITNHGTEPLRLQLTAATWRDDRDGAMQLGATNEIIIRPSLIEIAPGGSRAVRVGTTARPSGDELSFRVFVEELPDRRPVAGSRIQVLTRVGIPVFVAPKQRSTGATVQLALAPKLATLAVKTTGNMHIKLAKIVVRGVAGATTRWKREAVGWYVLPKIERRFVVDLPADGCANVDGVIAEITDEGGQTWTSAPMSCAN